MAEGITESKLAMQGAAASYRGICRREAHINSSLGAEAEVANVVYTGPGMTHQVARIRELAGEVLGILEQMEATRDHAHGRATYEHQTAKALAREAEYIFDDGSHRDFLARSREVTNQSKVLAESLGTGLADTIQEQRRTVANALEHLGGLTVAINTAGAVATDASRVAGQAADLSDKAV